LSRKVAYWVLRRRGLQIEEIARLFNRPWYTIITGLRQIDRDLTSRNPPEWAVDIYPLAEVGFDELVTWRIAGLTLRTRLGVLAYLYGSVLARRGFPAYQQLEGLQILAAKAPLRRSLAWACRAALDTDPTGSIEWQAKKLGYRFIS
jgi:hypothetical protein